jgi:hypothetical protein
MGPIAAVEKSHRRRPIRATIGAGVEMFGRRASSPEDLFPPDRTAAVEGTNSGCHAVIPPSGRVRSPAPLFSVRPRHRGFDCLTAVVVSVASLGVFSLRRCIGERHGYIHRILPYLRPPRVFIQIRGHRPLAL